MKKKNIFDPVKEHFEVLVEYINFMELKKDVDQVHEIVMFLHLLDNIKKQCDIYLNYQLGRQGYLYANKKL